MAAQDLGSRLYSPKLTIDSPPLVQNMPTAQRRNTPNEKAILKVFSGSGWVCFRTPGNLRPQSTKLGPYKSDMTVAGFDFQMLGLPEPTGGEGITTCYLPESRSEKDGDCKRVSWGPV